MGLCHFTNCITQNPSMSARRSWPLLVNKYVLPSITHRPRLTPNQLVTQHPYPSPYVKGVSQMSIPTNHPEMLVQAHWNSPLSGFGNYNGHSKSSLESAFTLPLLGRKRPVLRAKLACLFCRWRKIQCRPLVGDHLGSNCQ
jgi:hypothetical protein